MSVAMACLILGVIVALRYAGELFLRQWIPIPVVPALIMSFFSLYFLMLEMRILGLVHYAKRRELGWMTL